MSRSIVGWSIVDKILLPGLLLKVNEQVIATAALSFFSSFDLYELHCFANGNLICCVFNILSLIKWWSVEKNRSFVAIMLDILKKLENAVFTTPRTIIWARLYIWNIITNWISVYLSILLFHQFTRIVDSVCWLANR